MMGVGGPCPFSILPLSIQLWKSTESLSQGSRIVLDTTRCIDLAAFLGAASTVLLSISPPWLTVGD
jgi:hypothetical protein